ncbi:MAG: DUF433 domain-containing protein [Promethearchaeota archaeon]
MQDLDRIELNPEICRGKPIVKGTRITIDFILELLAQGWTYSEICDEYSITTSDILAVLEYTRNLIKNDQIFQIKSPENC